MRDSILAVAVALSAACWLKPDSALDRGREPNPGDWPALDAQLLSDAAATYDFRLGIPAVLAVTPEGAVLFRRTKAREFAADLFELDTKTGTVTMLLAAKPGEEQLTEAERARRERTRTATRGVVDISVSADGETVMVPLNGVFYLLNRKTGSRRTIDPGGDAYDPRLSPDGRRVAFVRNGNVWVTEGGAAEQLTKVGADEEAGIADFAAQEELDRSRGFWWSPDSQQLLVQFTNTREMDTIYVADARHPDKPPSSFKYPRAGTHNAIIRLAMVPVTGGEPRFLDWAKNYEYLARVQWETGHPLTIVVLTREQTELQLIAYDEKLEGTTLVSEHDDAWINVPDTKAKISDPGNPFWLPDGSGFLWATERTGDAWTVELRAANGTFIRSITEPALGLRRIIGVDGTDALVEASDDALHSAIYRVPLGGGAPVKLSTDRGVATGDFENGVLIVATRLADAGTKTVAIANGRITEIPSVAEVPQVALTTKLETVQLEDRTHHVAITRPRNFDATKQYPVLLTVYAGPHSQYVDGARDTYLMDQWQADAGFIVVRSDGRGTPYRGRAWERTILKDLITIPLHDQIGALQAIAARYRELDMTRVGVTGWSFGGYVAAYAVLARPDVFAAAVAGAPVTDWKLYDTAYTERYMRMPKNNEAGYTRASALPLASKLERPLLILHGITDDNVHFAHTLALIESLYLAGKRAEVITLSSTHMVPDPKLAFANEQVQIEFFREHLK